MGESGPVREINSRGLLVRFVTYAIRCPKVARLAVERLQPTHFDEATQIDFFLIWFVAQQMWLRGGAVPHPQHLKDLSVNLMLSEGYTDPNIHAGVQNLIDEIYSFHEEPWNVNYGMELMNAFFNGVFTRQVLKLTQQSQTRDLALQEMLSEHRRLSITRHEPLDPFDLSEPPKLSVRIPTGATYFDLITGGGTIPTETYGILGPSSGGKTLMAIDVGCSMAERGRRVEYFLYEQPAEEIRPRMFSRAGGINTDDMRGKQWGELAETIREKIVSAAEKLKGKFILHDRSTEGDSVTDVVNVVRDSISAGHRPDLVVIDWLWPLVLRAHGTAVAAGRRTSERITMQMMMDEFKSLASEYKTCVLIVHQLSTEMAKRRPGKKPQWFNSAEAGSFAWLLHYCIAIGTQDERGYCWLVGSKSRGNAKMSLVVQCLGNFNKFKLPRGSMQYDERHRGFVNSGDANRMPGREKPNADSEEDDLIKGGIVI